MAKSTNEELGVIECDGCGTFASIRRRKNGKQLLYLHCKNCGLDQRSGANLQAKWEKAITQPPQQTPALQSENSEMQTQVVLHNPAPDEWVPQTEQINSELGAKEHAESSERLTSGTTEDSDSAEHGKSGFWGILAIAAVGTIAICTGARLQSP